MKELSVPPDKPVPWVFQLLNVTRVDERASRVTIKKRTWFEARAAAMIELGCGPDDLELIAGPFVIIKTKVTQ